MHIHLRLHRRQSRMGGMDITVAIFIFIIGIIINFIFVAVVVVVVLISRLHRRVRRPHLTNPIQLNPIQHNTTQRGPDEQPETQSTNQGEGRQDCGTHN